MAKLVPVDHDPFAQQARPKTVPVDNDPFAPQGEIANPWYRPITALPGNAWDVAKGVAGGVRDLGFVADGAFINGMNMMLPENAKIGQGEEGQRRAQMAANILPAADEIGNTLIAGGIQSIPGFDTADKWWSETTGVPRSADVPRNVQARENFHKAVIEPNNTPTKFWNNVSDHPVDAALIFAPGLGMASKGARAAGLEQTANVLSKTSKALDPASYVTAPTNSAIQMAGQIFKTPPEGQTRASAALLRKTLPKTLDKMDQLGPEAMLLDASPSMTGLARGVSSGVGTGTDDLVGALVAREQAKSQRLQDGSARIFGKGRDPEAMKKELRERAKAEAKPFYDQAMQQAPEFRTPELENILARQLTEPAKGMPESARMENYKWIGQIEDAWGADTPQDAVSRLHGLRRQLDNVTNPGPTATADQKNIAEAARNVRDVVDDILKNRIPGFVEADAAYAKRMGQIDSFDYGFNSLEGGKTAIWPETFAKEAGKMDRQHIAQGQSSRIGTALGTQANDLAAVKKMLGGPGDFNRQKLEKTFGPRRVQDGVNMIDAEGEMSQNFADIVRNSKTAQSQSAAEMIKNAKPFNVDAGMTTTGMAVKIPAEIGNFLLRKISGSVSTKTQDALAKALVGKKPTVEKLLTELDQTKGLPVVDKSLVRALLLTGSASNGQLAP